MKLKNSLLISRAPDCLFKALSPFLSNAKYFFRHVCSQELLSVFCYSSGYNQFRGGRGWRTAVQAEGSSINPPSSATDMHALQLGKSFTLCALIFPTVKWGQHLIYNCNSRPDSLMLLQHALWAEQIVCCGKRLDSQQDKIQVVLHQMPFGYCAFEEKPFIFSAIVSLSSLRVKRSWKEGRFSLCWFSCTLQCAWGMVKPVCSRRCMCGFKLTFSSDQQN